ncbi:MAG: response regulator [Deltaproteobacteria bacterium]|nr:response regulator [Candidatus Zymogenaceae bacterium]
MHATNNGILIVHEESAYADYLKNKILEDYPEITIETVNSAENALERINDRGFDLILSDIALTGMGGMNFFFKLRELHPELKVVLLYEYISEKEKTLLDRGGVFGCLEKPFVMESLQELVREVLG